MEEVIKGKKWKRKKGGNMSEGKREENKSRIKGGNKCSKGKETEKK